MTLIQNGGELAVVKGDMDRWYSTTMRRLEASVTIKYFLKELTTASLTAVAEKRKKMA